MERLITQINPIPNNTQHVHHVVMGERAGRIVSVAVVAVWTGAILSIEHFS